MVLEESTRRALQGMIEDYPSLISSSGFQEAIEQIAIVQRQIVALTNIPDMQTTFESVSTLQRELQRINWRPLVSATHEWNELSMGIASAMASMRLPQLSNDRLGQLATELSSSSVAITVTCLALESRERSDSATAIANRYDEALTSTSSVQRTKALIQILS